MLILTRKVGEAILIGDDITVMPVRIEGDKIRIGIEAPRGLKVLRRELDDREPISDAGDLTNE